MAKSKSKTPRKRKVQGVEKWSNSIIRGDFLSSAFFSKYKFTIVLAVALMMFYIAFKYECQTRMETIKILRSELAIEKSEAIRQQGLYKSRTRESSMQALVDTMHLQLKVQQQPPFKLSYDD